MFSALNHRRPRRRSSSDGGSSRSAAGPLLPRLGQRPPSVPVLLWADVIIFDCLLNQWTSSSFSPPPPSLFFCAPLHWRLAVVAHGRGHALPHARGAAESERSFSWRGSRWLRAPTPCLSLSPSLPPSPPKSPAPPAPAPATIVDKRRCFLVRETELRASVSVSTCAR